MSTPQPIAPAIDGTDTGRRDKPDGLHTWPEAKMLPAMLEWYRDGVVAKVDGISQADATRRPMRSETSIAGLVKHLAVVEEGWFVEAFAGEPMPEPFAGVDWESDPDWEFRTARDEPIEATVDRYRLACERAREATRSRGLDDIGADTSRVEFSLRYVYIHMIEETARHLGHLDILREILDGETGD